MMNLFRLMKTRSSLKPTLVQDTRARSSSARHLHLHGDNITWTNLVPHFGSQILYCRTAPEVESVAREISDTIETLKKSNDTIHAGFDVEWKPFFQTRKITRKGCSNPDMLGPPELGGKVILWGLCSLTEKLFSIKLKKCNLVQLGNWDAIELSRSQQEYAAANAVSSWRIYQVLIKSLPDATKGDELEKNNLKTDATKDNELKKKILKTVMTKGDESKKKILKTFTTKGDELKRKILKMALMPLLACKSWIALISDTFINSYKIKNQTIISTKSPEIVTMKVVENINSGVVVHLMDGIKGRHMSSFRLFWTKVDHNLRFCSSPVDNGTIIVHCNGLFLIGRTAQRLLVCNPATREVVALPPATYFPDALHKFSGVGIGLDRSTNKYKVVRIFLRGKGIGGIEVITVDGGNYNSWRRLRKYPHYRMTFNLTVVTVQGAAYWIINKVKINERIKDNDRPRLDIIRMDLSSEEFTVIDSPDRNQVILLAELQGHLCCYAEARDRETQQRTILVWLYNESDNIAADRWTLRYTIHNLPNRTLGFHASFMPIAIDREGCLLFEYRQLMHRYDPRTNEFYRTSTDDRDAYSLEVKTWYCHTTSYVETLMPLSTTTTTTTCD